MSWSQRRRQRRRASVRPRRPQQGRPPARNTAQQHQSLQTQRQRQRQIRRRKQQRQCPLALQRWAACRQLQQEFQLGHLIWPATQQRLPWM